MSEVSKILRSSKFALYGKPANKGEGSPILKVNVYNTNVGLSVYTNSDNDTDQGKWINAPMSYRNFIMFAKAFVDFVNGVTAEPLSLTHYSSTANVPEGEKGQREIVSYTDVNSDNDGVFTITMRSVDQSRPICSFEFGQDYWSVFNDPSTGEPHAPSKVSRYAALAWIESIIAILPHVVSDSVVEVAASKPAEGSTAAPQQNGGGNWKGNNGGGNNWKGNNNNGGGGGWKGNNNGGAGGGGWKGNGGGGNNWKGNGGGGGNWKGGGNNNRGGER